MGNFGGHALPGSFFIIFAIWWTIQIFRRYYRSLSKSAPRYYSTVTFPCSCLCGRLRSWEVEGFIKIFFTVVGFAIEIYTGFKGGHFVYLGNGQHATMFFFFGLSGVIDIMVHHRLPLPRGVEYISMLLALIVEGLLFLFHLEGREPLDVALHQLLLYGVFASVLATGLEMRYRRSIVAALGRAYTTFLQGTWFWQIGFIMYSPVPGAREWEQHNHDNIFLVTMMFAWHMAAIFLLMLLIGGAIGCVYRCRGDFSTSEYDSLNMTLIKKNSNGHTIVNLNDDSDSDNECDKTHLSQ